MIRLKLRIDDRKERILNFHLIVVQYKKRMKSEINMKKLIISLILLSTVLISGCGDKNLTLINFTSYNQLENPIGEYQSGDEYIFEVNQQRYKVMHGYLAEHLQIIGEDNDNKYKLILVDSNRKKLCTINTEKEYETLMRDGKTNEKEYDIESIRECTDTDGNVYILYSEYDTLIGNMFIEDLKSTHILEMDMDKYKVKQEYVFGESIVVLTVHDGYVYTMEDGRIYRELLGETGKQEYMADLGFRGTPNVSKIDIITFRTKTDGIKVTASIPDDKNKYSFKSVELLYMKYIDQPIESE